jgi:peroxiredoxin (alkyl hydroperoxide reductase subunit C)
MLMINYQLDAGKENRVINSRWKAMAAVAALFISSAMFTQMAHGDPGLFTSSSQAGTNNMQNQAKVGKPAPTFAMEAVINREFKNVRLVDFRGKWVVLFFYPLDFTYVCPTEITGFDKSLDAFKKLNAVVLGASVDSKYSHLAWIERGDLGTLHFPLLSDISKEVARSYGILDEEQGVALRALFIIDPNGNLQYQVVHNLSVGRNVEEVLRVLQALQTGELCPLGWKPGQKTLGK